MRILLLLILFIAPIYSEQQEPVRVESSYSEEKGLFIALWTKRLVVRSILPQDLPAYCALFSNPVVMAKFGDGQVKTAEATTKRFETSWRKRWLNSDPFSAMAVTLITPNADPLNYPIIGHVVMGYGDNPGQSELAFALLPEYWNQGYGTEAVTAVVKTLGPQLVQKGYLVDGAPLRKSSRIAAPITSLRKRSSATSACMRSNEM